LLRVVAVEGSIAPDPHGHHAGRGAYLHRDAGCLQLAERRRAFQRALRLPGGLDLTVLRVLMEARSGMSTHDTEAGRDGDERSMNTQR